MFCPSCGAEYAIELKYCNRCGANLSSALATQSPQVVVNITKPTMIVALTMMVVTLGGFGADVGGAINLAHFLHGDDPLIAMIIFGMLTIMTIDIFLARLLTRLINAALSAAQLQANQPRSFAAPPPRFSQG